MTYQDLLIIFSIYSPTALLVLRVGFGLVFVVHGWSKMRDLKKTQDNFDAMGFRPGVLWGTSAALLESFGGLLVILGIFTQPLAVLFAIEMLVATIWKIKQGQGFINGYEFDLMLFVTALVIVTLGGGLYTLFA